MRTATKDTIKLPPPRLKGSISLEEAIRARRSRRSFSEKALTQEQISQLLWSCQGITDQRSGFRAVPSAGALYPLEVYALTKDGLFHYIPEGHMLQAASSEDMRGALCDAAWGQGLVRQAALDIVICAVYSRIASRYGERGVRYTDMEAGHAGQNVSLQAAALGLGSCMVGAFDPKEVAKLLGLPKDEEPLYIIPVGYPK